MNKFCVKSEYLIDAKNASFNAMAFMHVSVFYFRYNRIDCDLRVTAPLPHAREERGCVTRSGLLWDLSLPPLSWGERCITRSPRGNRLSPTGVGRQVRNGVRGVRSPLRFLASPACVPGEACPRELNCINGVRSPRGNCLSPLASGEVHKRSPRRKCLPPAAGEREA
jgi:hypothetical protein